MAAGELEVVLNYMRRSTERALQGCALAGTEIPAEPEAHLNVRCWLHHAQVPGAQPVLFELHGGGFALGDARKGDALRQWICESFDVNVVGVDYRLAPEDPYPAALQDVLSAMLHFARCDYRYGIDQSAFYLLGYSAGANLALAAALASQEHPERQLLGLALHYPFVDAAEEPPAHPSRESLDPRMMRAFNEWYLAGADPRQPLVSPVYATDEQLKLLPRTVMYPVVGDSLYSQAHRLHKRMAALGCAVEWHPVDGVYHGYVEDAANPAADAASTMPETIDARPPGSAGKAMENLRDSLEKLLGPVKHDMPFPA